MPKSSTRVSRHPQAGVTTEVRVMAFGANCGQQRFSMRPKRQVGTARTVSCIDRQHHPTRTNGGWTRPCIPTTGAPVPVRRSPGQRRGGGRVGRSSRLPRVRGEPAFKTRTHHWARAPRQISPQTRGRTYLLAVSLGSRHDCLNKDSLISKRRYQLGHGSTPVFFLRW